MKECEEFLAWALPQLGLNHHGFRRLQKRLCKQVRRRCHELHLEGLGAYRSYLSHHPEEWKTLDGFCRISISRFFRNRPVFEELRYHHLPRLASEAATEGRGKLHGCCIGIASGEEPYSLRLLWDLYLRDEFPEVALEIIAFDAEPKALERAQEACYRSSGLQELLPSETQQAFESGGEWFQLKAEFREGVELRLHDIRHGLPGGPYDLVLCRNLAFTYFSLPSQLKLMHDVTEQLRLGGVFLIGNKESLPMSESGSNLKSGTLPGVFTCDQQSASLVGT